jgi:hypothetical protein
VAAVKYARGQGPSLPELEIINAIDRFGTAAILGRLIYRREALRWNYIQRIVQAVRMFDKTRDTGHMMSTEPELFRLSQRAIEIANG